jgi:hypothetical protein
MTIFNFLALTSAGGPPAERLQHFQQKNGHILDPSQNFFLVFETSNALAVYLELFQLIIFTRFLILSK